MDEVVKFTEEQFLRTSEPYDYLVQIESPTERDHEISVYKKYALKNCGISASTFREELKKAELKLAGSGNKPNEIMTEFPNQPLSLRCNGYLCNETGIWVNAGLYGPVCVCPQPIMPIRRITNYDTGERKVEIAFRDKGIWQSMIVPRSTLAAATRIVQPLSERGVFVDSESAKALVTYFTRMDASNSDLLPESHSATRMGWIDRSRFLPYEQDLLFDGDAEFGQMYRSIHEHGSKEAWFDLAGQVRRGKNIVPRVLLAASFASVLIKPLRKLPFFVHVWSDASGTGKTVGLMFAASVWADPNEEAGYVKNMNTTNVALELTSSFLGSLPLCLDELCLKDSGGYKGSLEEMVYQFCEGVGRARGTRNGGTQRQRQWNCCAISTGETPLIKEKARAGAVNRVLEVEFGEEPLFADNIAAANTVRDNFGFAGKMFIEALQQEGALDKISQYQREYYSKLLELTGITDKQAGVASILLAADKFAALKVFDDVYNLRVEDFAPIAKRKEDVDTNLRAYNWLMGTIAENNYMFQPTEYVGKVWGKLKEVGDQTIICIINTRFDELLYSAGFDSKSFRKWANRHGLLEVGNKRLEKQVRMNGYSVAQWCVCIKAGAMDDQPDNQPQYTQVELSKEEVPF